MANTIGVMERKSTPSAAQTHLQSSLRFDWAVVLLGLWMVGGVHLDAWAHHQFEVETFFTPWHGVLYSGFLALAAVLVGAFVRNLLQGAAWQAAMPVGYELYLAGAAVFMAGGAGDILWHTLFGIEVNVEALLSPTHLLLAFGAALVVTGPLRAAWERRTGAGHKLAELLPALLALALLLALFSFFTAYANLLAETIVAQGHRPIVAEEVYRQQGLGVAAILLQSALLMGVVLLAVRRWRLPFGSLTLVFTVAYALTISIHEDFYLLPFVALAGLGADALYTWLKPSADRAVELRWFAFGVPLVFYGLYFVTQSLTGGVWWTVHLWAGTILLAGVAGWLLSYAFAPPQITSEPGA